MSLAFEPIARPLAFLHALSAILLVGALTHGTVFLIRAHRRGQSGNLRRAERFWPLTLLGLALTLITGLLAYPTYRIRIRAEYLDRAAPLVAGLFDVKENYAAIALALLLACLILRREPPGTAGRTLLHDWFYHLATALAWIGFLLGLWVTLHRGIA